MGSPQGSEQAKKWTFSKIRYKDTTKIAFMQIILIKIVIFSHFGTKIVEIFTGFQSSIIKTLYFYAKPN